MQAVKIIEIDKDGSLRIPNSGERVLCPLTKGLCVTRCAAFIVHPPKVHCRMLPTQVDDCIGILNPEKPA